MIMNTGIVEIWHAIARVCNLLCSGVPGEQHDCKTGLWNLSGGVVVLVLELLVVVVLLLSITVSSADDEPPFLLATSV